MSTYYPTPDEMGRHEPFPGITLRTAACERMMLSLANLDTGAGVSEHCHPHEQVGMVLEGRAVFVIGGEEKTLGPGDLFRIPGGVLHRVTVLDRPARILDIFTPVREDYRWSAASSGQPPACLATRAACPGGHACRRKGHGHRPRVNCPRRRPLTTPRANGPASAKSTKRMKEPAMRIRPFALAVSLTALALGNAATAGPPPTGRPRPAERLFTCNPEALTPKERQRHAEVYRRLHEACKEVRELPNGYAWRFAPESELLQTAAEFVTLERRCCPFFTFTLDLERDDGPLWLRLTGEPGAKEVLKEKLKP